MYTTRRSRLLAPCIYIYLDITGWIYVYYKEEQTPSSLYIYIPRYYRVERCILQGGVDS